ncbi:MAG TPA: hypothetical protein VF766_14525 [Pyrinomonadaceae bacterium]
MSCSTDYRLRSLQLEDNLQAVEVKLSAAELAELDAMTATVTLYPHWLNINLVDARHKKGQYRLRSRAGL